MRRTFRNKPALRSLLRDLFLRATPDKQIFFYGTNPAENAATESYDGHTLTLFEDNAHYMLHEVCHHLLATSERREKINWELGESPFVPEVWYSLNWDQWKTLRNSKEYPAVRFASDEEADTCLLEMSLAKLLGCGSRALKARMHDADFEELPSKKDVLRLACEYPDALPSEMWAQLNDCYAE